LRGRPASATTGFRHENLNLLSPRNAAQVTEVQQRGLKLAGADVKDAQGQMRGRHIIKVGVRQA
jgi:hypothetical protein